MPEDAGLSKGAFGALRARLYDELGLTLGPDRETFVISRLSSRMRHRAVSTVDGYLALIGRANEHAERERFIHAITTHETHFFREPGYLEAMVRHARRPRSRPLRVWSAACSTGAEAYTVAMTLADAGAPPSTFEVVGTDVSAEVVTEARRGIFPLSLAARVPRELLRRYCLEGQGRAAGQLAIKDVLRATTSFTVHNLMHPAGGLGLFDVVLLRNVLIYFDPPAKRRALATVLPQLHAGGLLVVGQAESLGGLGDLGLRLVEHSVYARP